MIRNILLGCVFLSLAGCAGTQTIQVDTAPVQLNISKPGHPRVPSLSNVQWRVVTKNTLQAFIDEQTKTQSNSNPVFIAVSMSDYKSLTLNLAELQRYIAQQNAIIVYYEKAVTVKTDNSKKK